MNILGVDPSINNLGVSIFENKKLRYFGLLHPEKGCKDFYFDKSKSMFSQIVGLVNQYSIDKVVIEIPEHWGQSGYLARESGSIFKITFIAGMICSLPNVIHVTPSGWKGQLPKKVVANRLNSIPMFNKVDILNLDHNIMDSIGIAWWYVNGRV